MIGLIIGLLVYIYLPSSIAFLQADLTFANRLSGSTLGIDEYFWRGKLAWIISHGILGKYRRVGEFFSEGYTEINFGHVFI
jgi:hypothetical protein